jgi:hypothetical protein
MRWFESWLRRHMKSITALLQSWIQKDWLRSIGSVSLEVFVGKTNRQSALDFVRFHVAHIGLSAQWRYEVMLIVFNFGTGPSSHVYNLRWPSEFAVFCTSCAGLWLNARVNLLIETSTPSRYIVVCGVSTLRRRLF